MYIRRKVFSLLLNEEGLEKYFSTTEFELDDDISERYYSEEEETPKKKGLSKKAKIALGIGGAALATAGAIYGAKKGGLKLGNIAGKRLAAAELKLNYHRTRINNRAAADRPNKMLDDMDYKHMKEATGDLTKADRLSKISLKLQSPADKISKAWGTVKGKFSKKK